MHFPVTEPTFRAFLVVIASAPRARSHSSSKCPRGLSCWKTPSIRAADWYSVPPNQGPRVDPHQIACARSPAEFSESFLLAPCRTRRQHAAPGRDLTPAFGKG